MGVEICMYGVLISEMYLSVLICSASGLVLCFCLDCLMVDALFECNIIKMSPYFALIPRNLFSFLRI